MKYTYFTVSVKIMLLLLFSLSLIFYPVEADEIKLSTMICAKNKVVNGSDANLSALMHAKVRDCDKNKYYSSVNK